MSNNQKLQLLVFDSAYTHEMMMQRNLLEFVTSRDLSGFFSHVWSVNPTASIVLPVSSPHRYGSPAVQKLNSRHTIIEGKIGKYAKLAWFPAMNFILAQLELFWYLYRVAKKNHVTFIRAEDPYYNGMTAVLFSALMKIPLMIGVWGNPGKIRKFSNRPLMPRLFKWVWLEEKVERFVLRRADRVMVQNHDNIEFVLQHGVHQDRTAIFRLGNAIHPLHFKEPSSRKDGTVDLKEMGVTQQKVLLCISRLEALKLTDHVIRVVSLLKAKGWNIKALFVGDGSFRNTMADLAEELDVVDQIVFCGNQGQEWLARIIPCASVVLSPLTGRALAEAALGGVPIVAYDVDWHGELVETGITGELVPYLQHSLMADAVERFLNDKAYGKKAGANVRERALKLMDACEIEEAQIAVYEKLLVPMDTKA